MRRRKFEIGYAPAPVQMFSFAKNEISGNQTGWCLRVWPFIVFYTAISTDA